MKTKKLWITMIVAPLAAASLAGAASVKYDLDRAVDFSKYRTVAFTAEASKGSDAIADKRVRAALAAELEAKGYALVAADEADLALDYFAVVRERREVSESGGPRFGRNLRLRRHPEGTLVVSFAERGSGEVVWQGAVSDALASNPEKADKKTEKAVRELLEDFPSRKTL